MEWRAVREAYMEGVTMQQQQQQRQRQQQHQRQEPSLREKATFKVAVLACEHADLEEGIKGRIEQDGMMLQAKRIS